VAQGEGPDPNTAKKQKTKPKNFQATVLKVA
jgi:hypothetical protein